MMLIRKSEALARPRSPNGFDEKKFLMKLQHALEFIDFFFCYSRNECSTHELFM